MISPFDITFSLPSFALNFYYFNRKNEKKRIKKNNDKEKG